MYKQYVFTLTIYKAPAYYYENDADENFHSNLQPESSPSNDRVQYVAPEWCKCLKCQPMPQEIENICCRQKNCVTKSTRFQKLCLDPEVLELCIKNRADIRNYREDNSTRSLRKAAYRQYILDRYGRLGKGNRKVAPSCVVLQIRHRYPSVTGIYMGFRPH